jgi:uncharacterized protein
MCLPLLAQQIPEPMQPPRLVNDFASMLTSGEQNLLEHKLRNYLDTTSTQLYIVTINDFNGDNIADYASKLFNKWEIGQRDKNNGLLILIKPKNQSQRGEIFISTGYGLEGAIPDAYSKQIISRDIEPAFIQGQYYQGLDKSTTTLMNMAACEYTADDENKDIPISGVILFALLIILLLFIVSKNSKGGGGGFTRGGFPGSRFGGFGGFGGGRTGGGGSRGGW